MKVSVIIPTLNEAENIDQVIAALAVKTDGPHEVIVVDGGSDDGTESIARDGGARVIHCDPAGRARQMNCGAEEAQGEILFFLHGDTVVPDGALDRIFEICMEKEVVGGGFIRRFDSTSKWLSMTCRLADWRSQRWGIFLGDQGIYVRRKVFESMGGFDEGRSHGEDLIFSIKLREEGRTVALHPEVISSARRFENQGPVITTLHDVWWTIQFLFSSRG